MSLQSTCRFFGFMAERRAAAVAGKTARTTPDRAERGCALLDLLVAGHGLAAEERPGTCSPVSVIEPVPLDGRAIAFRRAPPTLADCGPHGAWQDRVHIRGTGKGCPRSASTCCTTARRSCRAARRGGGGCAGVSFWVTYARPLSPVSSSGGSKAAGGVLPHSLTRCQIRPRPCPCL
jgi:hypothetical protein